MLTERRFGGETRTRWSGNHGLEKKRNSEGNLRFHDREVRKQIWAFGKTCNREQEKKEDLLLGDNRDLTGQGWTELMNLGGKRMNSTKLHSLLRDACRRNGSQRLWCATLESKATNKGEGKNQAGTLQGRRCRQRVQRGTHAGCGGFQRAGKTGEAPGAWQQREKERKRKGNGSWAGGLNWARRSWTRRSDDFNAS